MSASHSTPIGAGNWEPPFAEHDPRDLERLIRSILDQHGPLPFGELWDKVVRGIYVHPSTLHDALNNLIAAGTVQIPHTGFYLLG